MDRQVKSRQRVADHGEVLTGQREVNAMLDLVKSETERIDSRFLEPACGTGNFLAEILRRKLRIVESRYAKSQADYEQYVVLAVGSVYGIDILADNVRECRQRLFDIFNDAYTRLHARRADDRCRQAVRFILDRNIIHGDALSLKTAGDDPRPIIFSEWSLIGEGMIKRRDFTFHGLLEHAATKGLPLFSDLGEDVFIPEAERDFPPTHFLKLAEQTHHGELANVAER